MSPEGKKLCPTCNGKKEMEGQCECNSEWRGNQVGDDWEDCQCTPSTPCPTCKGTGYVSSDA